MCPKTDLTVPPEALGERLDVWLADALDDFSRSSVARLIDHGLVTVDGLSRVRSFRLEGGERIELRESAVPEPDPAAAEAQILFEDDALLVVDKPAGLVVHPAPGHRARTLVDQLRERGGGEWEPQLVHRLDRGTSGLMLIAKDQQTQLALQRQLRERELEREYLTLAAGRLDSRTGTIDAPIGRDRSNRTRMSVDTAKPKEAVTHFEVELLSGDDTLLRVRLETGRTHQIRAHFAAVGHPICGDPEYGGRGRRGLDRQFLHSARIAFTHPDSGARLEFSSELPVELQRALDSPVV